jgi:hypothetical protein
MFDPYHKWLGIPPEQQPPSYYRLLGVDPRESDPEVIEEMAIRQTSHVRTYQIGPHAEECTRLLGEIGQAARVLLDPERRRAYDRRLGRQRGAPGMAAAPTPVAVEAAVSPGWVLVPEPPAEADFADLPVPIRRRLGRHTWHGVLALAVAVLLFAAGGLAAWRVLGEAAISFWQPEPPPAGAGFGREAPRTDPGRKPRGAVPDPPPPRRGH